MIRFLRRLLCRQNRQYAAIRYRVPGTPEENSTRLVTLLAEDFHHVRNRTDEECVLFGRFMSVVLMLERKLECLLLNFDPEIEQRMFGQKIDVFKDLLNSIDWGYIEQEIEEYRALIAPLKELKSIRDTMAHDLSKSSFSYADIQQTVGIIRTRRPDLYAAFQNAEPDEVKAIGAVMTFGFVFSEELAHLQGVLD